MSNRALLVVDLQNEYFPGGKLLLDGIEAAATNAARVIAAARARGDLVVHIRHEMPGEAVFTPGSEGAEINATVRPEAGETVVTKHFPSCFRDTPLKELLDRRAIEDVVVIGAMSHMCIDATVRAAADLGYRTTTVHDACATMALEFGGTPVPAAQVHAAIMAALADAYGEVVGTEAILAR